MFGFGYALVPMYRAICEALGINVLTLSEQRIATGSWTGKREVSNTQVDRSRSSSRASWRNRCPTTWPQPNWRTTSGSTRAGTTGPPSSDS